MLNHDMHVLFSGHSSIIDKDYNAILIGVAAIVYQVYSLIYFEDCTHICDHP